MRSSLSTFTDSPDVMYVHSFVCWESEISTLRCEKCKKFLVVWVVHPVAGELCLTQYLPAQSFSRVDSAMPDCNHEEADTRIVVHLLHALEHGMRTIKVRIANSDVIAILVGAFFNLTSTQSSVNVWVTFDTGKNFRFYSINAIINYMHQYWRAKSTNIISVPCTDRRDTTSAFRGRGKKSAWQAYEEVTFLASHPFELLYAESDHFQRIQLYCMTKPVH